MTPAQVLRDAADLLEHPGAWTQRALARNTAGLPTNPCAPNAVCWCAAGAIQRAAGYTGSYSPPDAYYAAYRAFNMTAPVGMAVFNDRPDQTQERVVSMLRRAAANAS